MIYLIGTDEQRKAWQNLHDLPYFECEEKTWNDCIVLSNRIDEKAALYIDLQCNPAYTLHVFDAEIGGVVNELVFADYETAIAAYRGVEDA